MRIGVMGAGAIGCYLGGRLRAAGCDVVLIGRDSLAGEIATSGMRLTDCDGGDQRIPPRGIEVATKPAPLRECAVVLVTVKSQDTPAAARELAANLASDAVVVSFQNGVHNVEVLEQALLGPGNRRRVLGGMVPYNVLREDGGSFHRGTTGALIVGDCGGVEVAIVNALTQAGLDTEVRKDVNAVQWGKLLFNLNNAVNALAGIPLRQQLSQRAYRLVMAAIVEEALNIILAAGVKPVLAIKVPPKVVPLVMRLPDFLFFRVAKAMVQVDERARSSMADDFARGRRTEIDFLNGEIVRLAAAQGRVAPINAKMVELVRDAEAAGRGSPQMTAVALQQKLGLSRPGGA